MKIIITESQFKRLTDDEMDKINDDIRNRAIKKLESIKQVDGPGIYQLYRGSHDGNQHPSYGIYGNGIHYSSDISTAYDFGEPYHFKVKIKNPLIITNQRELRDYGKNSKEVTKTLLDLGYDTLVLKHKKIITGYGSFDYIYELPYYESEVIKLKDI